jgi:ABC-2 type transport system ATP-binding protein
MPTVLEFESVTKDYGGVFSRRRVRALDDFSLAVEPGEIFGFLGPNGAGKTTAIHLALGFMRPTKGSGLLLGEPFGKPRVRRRVGFLAENVALYHRPASRLLRFYGALSGLRDPELSAATRTMLGRLELSDVAARNTGKFSRGMLQRVGLAQAMINDPDLLILDEPTSALDPLGRVAVRELLLQARKVGKTIFISSHLLSEIELICDRIGIVHRGKLVRLGRTTDMLESDEEYEISARGVATNDFPQSTAEDGLVRFLVSRQGQRQAIEKIWERGGEVVRVSPARKSLEDIFVELTSDARKPGAGE